MSFTYDIWANLLSATVTKGDDVPMLSVGAGSQRCKEKGTKKEGKKQ